MFNSYDSLKQQSWWDKFWHGEKKVSNTASGIQQPVLGRYVLESGGKYLKVTYSYELYRDRKRTCQWVSDLENADELTYASAVETQADFPPNSSNIVRIYRKVPEYCEDLQEGS